jgi:hypothetical protein
MTDRYDPANWLKHNRASIFHTGKPGTLIDTGKEYRSPLLFVRWTRSGRPGGEVAGLIEAEIISPLGRPARPSQLFNISTDPEIYQFWNVTSDRLPYRLHARMVDNPKITSQLEVWEFIPLLNLPQTPMGQVNNPIEITVDLSDVTAAIQAADLNNQNMAGAAQGQLNAIANSLAPASAANFTEFKVNPWAGNSLNGLVFDPAPERRSITFTVPKKNESGQTNTETVYLAVGEERSQENDYGYGIAPGGSLTLAEHEAPQRLCAWLRNNANNPVMCNVESTIL